MTRLTVHLEVVYEVEGTLPPKDDEDASTAFLHALLDAVRFYHEGDVLFSRFPAWQLDPLGWRVSVEGYGDLTVGPDAFEETCG